MPVQPGDNASAPSNIAAATSGTLTTLNITSRANQVLVVQVGFQIQSVSAITITWDSTGGSPQNCTLIDSQATPGTSAQGIAYLFGLVNPNPGSGKTLALSWTTSSAAEVNACTFFNVDQITPFKNVAKNSGTSTTPNVTVSCGVNDMAVDIACAPNQVPFPVGQTSLFTASTTSPNSSGSYGSGPTVAFSYGPMGGSDVWADIGVALNFATSGAVIAAGVGGGPGIVQSVRMIGTKGNEQVMRPQPAPVLPRISGWTGPQPAFHRYVKVSGSKEGTVPRKPGSLPWLPAIGGFAEMPAPRLSIELIPVPTKTLAPPPAQKAAPVSTWASQTESPRLRTKSYSEPAFKSTAAVLPKNPPKSLSSDVISQRRILY